MCMCVCVRGCNARSVRGKPYRYAFGTAATRPTNMGNSLARHDLAQRTSMVWHEPGATAGERARMRTCMGGMMHDMPGDPSSSTCNCNMPLWRTDTSSGQHAAYQSLQLRAYI